MSFKGRLRRLDDKLGTGQGCSRPNQGMALGPGRILRPVSWIQTDSLPRETTPRSGTVHRGPLVPPVRQDPLRSCPPTLVMSPKQRIQRDSIGARCPPVEDHHPEDYRISSKAPKIRGIEASQDEARVLQRKQNSSRPKQSGDDPRRTRCQPTLRRRVLVHQR